MAWLFAKFVALGVPARFIKPLLIALAVILIIAVFGVAKCRYDRELIVEHDAAARAKQAEADRKADNQAADQRLGDEKTIDRQEREINAAVNALPDARLTDRQRARACAILMRQARDRGAVPPAACGPSTNP